MTVDRSPWYDEVLGPRHHSLGRPVNRLSRGCGVTVDRSPGHALGPPSCKHGTPCDIARLRPHLRGAAEDHVVYRTAIYAHPFDKLRQHFC